MKTFAALTLCLLTAITGFSQTLNVPSRATNAMTGAQFVNVVSAPMALTERENWIYAQVAAGNVPSWLKTLSLVTTNTNINSVNHTVSYYTTPDYLAIGSDADYMLQPMSPMLAQRLSKLLNCTLPTRKMVSDTWTKAAVKLAPNTMTYNQNDPPITELYFYTNNLMIWTQRQTYVSSYPMGALTSGDKKDVIISTLIYNNLQPGVPNPVVIFGWYQQNGVYIQGEVNVHDQTYMDYSHGDRMVQQAITVDGTNNTVTNVLTNPALAALLSDETTFTGNTIPQPYYTVSAVAPTILNNPASRVAKTGNSVVLSVLAAGDPPLNYSWQWNGQAIPGATNAMYGITNALTTNAGSYTVVITNNSGSVTSSAATLQVTTNSYPLLFADDFDVDSSANWNLYWAAASGSSPDYSINWAYDYGATRSTYNGTTHLIPPAPNSTGSTKGVRMAVNSTNGINLGLNIYPKNKSFSNNFAVKFDMWVNYPGAAGGSGSTGSTQFPIMGINHLGTQVNWAATSATSSDGLWFAADGDGGTTRDYRAYLGNLSGVETELIGTGSGLSQSNHATTIYQTLFTTPPSETTGTPGKTWVQVELDQTNGVINWKMNGTVIATRSNTSGFTNGTIMLGLMDVFPSIASPVADSFVLFDNVRVEDLTGALINAPTINTQPQGLNLTNGGSGTLSVVAGGTSPFTYQWYQNGAAISAQTNSSDSLSNVQVANAGSYVVQVSNTAGSAWSVPAVVTVSTNSSGFPILFSDNFDTDASTNWSVYWSAQTGNVADYSLTWAFDYGSTHYTSNGVSLLIPPSPNSSGTTKGVRMAVNSTNGINLGLNIYPKNKVFNTNYVLKFDMWLNYPGNAGGGGGAGTTQFSICGIDHLGTEVNWASTNSPATDGIWFAVDGEGGTSRDYRAYVGNRSGTNIELIGLAASGMVATDNVATVYQSLFPTPPAETAGSPGKSWVAMEVGQSNGVVTWKMNNTIVAQRTNTSSFTNGTVMLGLMDVFPSLASPAADCYVIFDNVRVEDHNAGSQNLVDSVPQTNSRPSLGSPGLSGSDFQFMLSGQTATTWVVDQSSNLFDWVPMKTSSVSGIILDPGALTAPQRFYRARVGP